jgi:hypothetical protein
VLGVAPSPKFTGGHRWPITPTLLFNELELRPECIINGSLFREWGRSISSLRRRSLSPTGSTANDDGSDMAKRRKEDNVESLS